MNDSILQQKTNDVLQYLLEVVKLSRQSIRHIEAHQDFKLFERDVPITNEIKIFPENRNSWLVVKQQDIEKKPQLSEELKFWINAPNNPSQKLVIHEEKIILDENAENKTIFLHDDESMFLAVEEYEKKWVRWAEKTTEKRVVQDIFSKLFHLKSKLTYGGDYELIWGQGIIDWQKEHEIKYPLFTRRVTIDHDLRKGEIHIVPIEESDFQLEISPFSDLISENLYNIKDLEMEDLDAGNRASFVDAQHQIIRRLSPDAKIVDSLEDRKKYSVCVPVVINNWCLFLRKRKEDFIIKDIENFQEKLKHNFRKNSLLPFLVMPETNNISHLEIRNEWQALLDKNILFTLPANNDQIQILDRIERFDNIVVQGPPGTGKSHTIANLISQFVAQGKRVLVTSQKDQALSVLEKMIPEGIRSICVSLLNNDANNRRKLENAVSDISSIVTNEKSYQLENYIQKLECSIEEKKSQAIKISDDIKKLVDVQLVKIKLGRIELPLSEWVESLLTDKCFTHKARYEVKEYENNKEIIVALPDKNIINDLQRLRKKLLPLLDELKYAFPDPQDLLTAKELDHLARSRKEKSTLGQKLNELKSRNISLKDVSLNINDDVLKQLGIAIAYHRELKESWQTKFFEGLEDFDEIRKVNKEVSKLWITYNQVRNWHKKISIMDEIFLPPDKNIKDIYDTVKNVVLQINKGKKIFGLLTPKFEKEIIQNIKFNGNQPVNAKQWCTVYIYVSVQYRMGSLNRFCTRLSKFFGTNFTPNDSVKKNLSNVDVFLSKAIKALYYHLVCKSNLKEVLSQSITIEHNILGENLKDVYIAIKVYKQLLLLKNQEQRLSALQSYLDKFAQNPSCHPHVTRMKEILNNIDFFSKNQNEWQEMYNQMMQLNDSKSDYELLHQHVQHVEQYVLTWSSMWLCPNQKNSSLCPDRWEKLIEHNSIHEYIYELTEQAKEIAILQRKQTEYEEEIRSDKSDLSFAKTKQGLINNTSEKCLQALKSWLYAVKKLGKGTGKSAPKWRKEIKREMKEAQNAVPVWIMPLYRISESIPSDFSVFDILIVDEASQCDQMAFLALLRSKKVIVVGDDKQISPSGVGVSEKDMNALTEKYLFDIPGGNRYGVTTSLYDLANISFQSQGNLMLREHFRCVPEIIEFCNSLCYHNKIIPLRNPMQKEKLEPIINSVFIPPQKMSRAGKVNEAEAFAICQKLRELNENQKYKGKTFGVISLLGNEQANFIIKNIDSYISPEDQERRKLRIGDSYTFQGDERDIIILSMVKAKEDGKYIKSLTKDTTKQRFNVAVSRARDQIFLFHSLKLEEHLHNPDDFRYQLLEFFTRKKLVNKSYEEHQKGVPRIVQNYLLDRGYKIIPNFVVGEYTIQLVVEGSGNRVAIVCEDHKINSVEEWWQASHLQRQLERVGWKFWRIWGATFFLDQEKSFEKLISFVKQHGIEPSSYSVEQNLQDTFVSSDNEHAIDQETNTECPSEELLLESPDFIDEKAESCSTQQQMNENLIDLEISKNKNTIEVASKENNDTTKSLEDDGSKQKKSKPINKNVSEEKCLSKKEENDLRELFLELVSSHESSNVEPDIVDLVESAKINFDMLPEDLALIYALALRQDTKYLAKCLDYMYKIINADFSVEKLFTLFKTPFENEWNKKFQEYIFESIQNYCSDELEDTDAFLEYNKMLILYLSDKHLLGYAAEDLVKYLTERSTISNFVIFKDIVEVLTEKLTDLFKLSPYALNADFRLNSTVRHILEANSIPSDLEQIHAYISLWYRYHKGKNIIQDFEENHYIYFLIMNLALEEYVDFREHGINEIRSIAEKVFNDNELDTFFTSALTRKYFN